MNMHRTATAIGVALAMLCTPAASQDIRMIGPGGEPIQLPGAGRQMKTGTGRIKGRLVAAETGAPLRRAQVRLSGPDVMPKIVFTDTEGVYEFRDLPAGKFTITATKSGFVNVGYGQTRPFEAPKSLELREGQSIDRVDITLPRGSAISGRIADEFGEPLADATVTALRSTWSNGRRRLQPTGRTATTNDLGQYRIFGLPPGEYYVSATLRGSQEMIVTEMAMVAMSTGGPAPDTPRSGYAPTYYPGTSSGSEAQRVALSVGQEVQNADFGLLPVRLAKVTGTVVGSDGRPLAGVSVSATPRNPAESTFMILPGTGARTDNNGNFTLNGVAPGDYTLNARGMTVVTSSGDGNRMVFQMRTTLDGGGGDGQSEFGSVPLSVSGEDVSNVMILTSKGATASGRLVWDGGSKPLKIDGLRVSAAAPDADNPLSMLGGSASVTPEGTFEIRGLAGQRIFRPSNVPVGWVLQAVKLNGEDITDSGVEIKPNQPVSGLEIVLTSRTTEVNGAAKAGNAPATDYTVVIFSEDPQKWTLPMNRHVTSTRPNQEGRFQVKNLPAGNYYAIALEYIAQGDWNDPEVLERLKSKATRFTLDEGQVESLELKLQQT
jgi:protocatechuate 3,4-dioxygenase beta subunit